MGFEGSQSKGRVHKKKRAKKTYKIKGPRMGEGGNLKYLRLFCVTHLPHMKLRSLRIFNT